MSQRVEPTRVSDAAGKLHAERARLLLELRALESRQPRPRRPLPVEAADAVMQGVREHLAELDRQHRVAVDALHEAADREAEDALAAARREVASIDRAIQTMANRR